MRKTIVLAIGALLVTVALGLGPASAFHADGVAVLATQSQSGNGAFAVRVGGAAPYAVDLYGMGPATGQEISVAAFFLDQNNNVVFGFAFTGHRSPERLILVALEGDAANLPPGVEVKVDTPETDAACTFACIGITGAAGTETRAILWVGAVSSSTLEIRGTPGVTTFNTNSGVAHVVGDAEIDSGMLNVQAQRRVPAPVNQNVGVKVMRGAGVEVDVGSRLYGFWGTSDFKLACQFGLGACVWKSGVEYEFCRKNGIDCSTSKISYSGPDGVGKGRSTYGFLGGSPGTWTFTVDEKTEVYGPLYFERNTGTFAFLGEDFSYLTIADVAPA